MDWNKIVTYKNDSFTLKQLYFTIPKAYVKRSLYVNQKEKSMYIFVFTMQTLSIQGNIIRINGLVNELSFTVIHSKKMIFLFKKNVPIKLCGEIFAKTCYYPDYRDLRTDIIAIYKGDKSLTISLLIAENPIEDEYLNSLFKKIHLPKQYNEINEGFNELLKIEIYFAIKFLNYQTKYREPLKIQDKIPSNCPLIPRKNQLKVIHNIYKYLEKSVTMNCLLYGDVGSGKTFVAFEIIMQFIANKKRVAFMAPTGVLVNQVYKLFNEWTEGVSLVTNKTKKIDLKSLIFVGTHALLFAELPKIDLLIIDEQHKFGVNQRNQILEKHGCDCLMMTATPIPRTFQMIMHGLIQFEQLESEKFNRSIYINDNKELVLSRVLNICSEKAILWIINNIKKANEFYEELSKTHQYIFIIHSEIKNKEEILTNFTHGILISTTVIEVGIDLDIFCIVIENANSFGVSQLHQLCGRVGRKGTASHVVFLDKNSDKLQTFKNVEDGWKRSEFDYENRGGGTIHNVKQSGFSAFVFNLEINAMGELIVRSIDESIINNATKTPYSEKYAELFTISEE